MISSHVVAGEVVLNQKEDRLRERAEKAEAQYEEVCGENAELNDKIREAFDAKEKAEAERDGLRDALKRQVKKAVGFGLEARKFREALILLLHHMPLRGEPVTAKELVIARARDVLAGTQPDQEARCDCYPSKENWMVCRYCGKDLGEHDAK